MRRVQKCIEQNMPLYCLSWSDKGIKHYKGGVSLDLPEILWMSKEICEVDSATLQQNDKTGSLSWWYISCICYFQWSKTGLCAKPSSIESVLHLHVTTFCLGSEGGIVYQVPIGWPPLWPSPLECTRCFYIVIQETLFANDCAFLMHKDSDFQLMLNNFWHCYGSDYQLIRLSDNQLDYQSEQDWTTLAAHAKWYL